MTLDNKRWVSDVIKFIGQITTRTKQHQMNAFAAQIAYFFVLSFFPLVIFLLSMISSLNLDYEMAIGLLESVLPDNIRDVLPEVISSTLSTKGVSVLSISGIAMLYSSSRAVGALQRAINTSYEVQETRHFIKVKLMGMLYTFLFTLIIVLSLMIPDLIIQAVTMTAQWLSLTVDNQYLIWIQYLRNLLLITTFVVVIVTIYAFLPNKKMHLRNIVPGAIFAIFGSLLTNYIFSKLVVAMTDYSILYGSLSAIIAFMIWVYSLSVILILGAEFNAMRSSIKSDNR